MNHGVVIAIIFALSIGTTVGDYFLKRASQEPVPILTGLFLLGTLTYAATAFGWVCVMPHIKLASLAAIFSVSTTLLLVALGTIVFKESLTISEAIGIAMAILSLVLLNRHL